MTEESGPDGMLAKEQILAELMRQGITTPEEVLDETIPEVGGFMISSGGLSRGTGKRSGLVSAEYQATSLRNEMSIILCSIPIRHAMCCAQSTSLL